MKNSGQLLTALTVSALAIAGCSSTEPAKRTVSRIETDKQIDLSGKWNDTDSKLVAEEIITDALNSPWLESSDYTTEKKPVVTVGTITNKTAEHIDVSIFIDRKSVV